MFGFSKKEPEIMKLTTEGERFLNYVTDIINREDDYRVESFEESLSNFMKEEECTRGEAAAKFYVLLLAMKEVDKDSEIEIEDSLFEDFKI